MTRLMATTFLLIAVSLSACAPRSFQAEVTRFHAISAPVEQGTKMLIKPMGRVPHDDAFQFLSDRLTEGFAPLGFVAAAGQAPDVILYAHFQVSTTRTERDEPASRLGIGVGGGSRGSTVGIGTAFNVKAPPVTLQNRQLVVTLEDAKTGARLFEGRVNSHGQGTDTDKVLPVIIKALLKDFPGVSGETLTLSLSR